MDQALCLHDLMHAYFLKHHHYPVVALLDISSAYDTVDRNIVWQALSASGPAPVVVNSLLFADDMAVFGDKHAVQDMLALAEQHSYSLGYRWNPSKCMVLNHPSPTSSTSHGLSLSLYGVPLPHAEEVAYLGLPFGKKGLSASSLVSSRPPGVLKVMGILNLVGVNRAGFSLCLCSYLYTTFVRPKFEYGLAISFLKAAEFKALEKLQDRCLRLLVGGHPTSSTTVLKHITNLPSMRHRVNVLVTRSALRFWSLPSSCLLVLLSASLPMARRTSYLVRNPLYLALPDPVPAKDSQLKLFFEQYRQQKFDLFLASTTMVLIKHCHPLLGIDPVLLVPATRAERSRLVRWRLGWLPGQPRECSCGLDHTSRRHLLECPLVPASLWSLLPICSAGVYPIDFCLNSLSTRRGAPCPVWWPTLLSLLWHIEILCRPDHFFPEDLSPGALWLAFGSSSGQG